MQHINLKYILLVLFQLIITSYISACGCSEVPDFEESSNRADEIFYGKLVSIKDCEDFLFMPVLKGESCWKATFKVLQKWKGNNNKFISIYQPHTSCDAYFDSIGNHYLIYAFNSDIFFIDTTKTFVAATTHLCERNADERIINGEFDDRPLLNQKYRRIRLIDYRLFLFPIALVFAFLIYKKVTN